MKKHQPVDILAELRAHVARKYINQIGAAAAWGYSPAFVSGVLSGKKAPTEKILADAGFKRISEVRYERA